MAENKVQIFLRVKDQATKALVGFTGRFKKTVGQLASHWKGFAIAGAAALGTVTALLIKATKAANVQELAEKKLEAAFGRTSQALLDQASALQKMTTFGDEEIISAQAMIASFVKEEDAVKKATKASLDLAAAKGMNLVAAADLVSKTLGSTTNALARYGIQVEGAVGSTERLESLTGNLAAVFGGQATAQAQTFGGALTQMKNAAGDALEQLGFIITKNETIVTSVQGLTVHFANLATQIGDSSSDIGKAVRGAMDGAVQAFNIFLLSAQKVAEGMDFIAKAAQGLAFNQEKARKEDELLQAQMAKFEELTGKSAESYNALGVNVFELTEEFENWRAKGVMVSKEIEHAQRQLKALDDEVEVGATIFDTGAVAIEGFREKLNEINFTFETTKSKTIEINAEISKMGEGGPEGLKDFMDEAEEIWGTAGEPMQASAEEIKAAYRGVRDEGLLTYEQLKEKWKETEESKAEESRKMFDSVQSIAMNYSETMVDSMLSIEGAWKGSFSKLLIDFSKMIAKMIVKALLLKAIRGIFSGGVGLIPGLHEGGLVMHEGGRIPRYQIGGRHRGVREREVVLEEDEFVVNRDATRRNLPLLSAINQGKQFSSVQGGAGRSERIPTKRGGDQFSVVVDARGSLMTDTGLREWARKDLYPMFKKMLEQEGRTVQ